MKRIQTTLLILCIFPMLAQAQSFSKLDKSPGDISYFPKDFAHDRIFDKETMGKRQAVLKVIYNRPLKKDREIFGKLVPFDKVWRTGANEAAEIKVYKDVTFGGKKLKKGTYSLYSIPGKDNWTIIFNKDLDYWGAYTYKEANDVLRVTATVKKVDQAIEAFSIVMEDKGPKEGVLYMGWDDTVVEVPFSF